jgi:hypothetical protein
MRRVTAKHAEHAKWRGLRRSQTAATAGREGDFMRQENRIRGNTRTVRRQYAARKWPSVRVLPGIAGYCRVAGPWEKVDGLELMVESQNHARPHPGLVGFPSPPRYGCPNWDVRFAHCGPQEKEPPAVARRTGSGSWVCFSAGDDSAARAYRFVPAGTAWYRINFFLRCQRTPLFRWGIIPESACGSGLQGHNP